VINVNKMFTLNLTTGSNLHTNLLWCEITPMFMYTDGDRG